MDPQVVKTPIPGTPLVVSAVYLEGARPEKMVNRRGVPFVAHKIPGMPWIYDNRADVVAAMTRATDDHEGDNSFDSEKARQKVVHNQAAGPAFVQVLRESQADGRISHVYVLDDVRSGSPADEGCAFSVIFVDEPEDNIIFDPYKRIWMNLRTQSNGVLVVALTGIDHPLGITTPNRKWLLTDKVETHNIPLTDDQLKDALGDRIKERPNNGKAQRRPERDKPESHAGSNGNGWPNWPEPIPPVADDERTETSEPDPVGVIESDGSELVQSVGEVDSSIGACVSQETAAKLAEACAGPVEASS